MWEEGRGASADVPGDLVGLPGLHMVVGGRGGLRLLYPWWAVGGGGRLWTGQRWVAPYMVVPPAPQVVLDKERKKRVIEPLPFPWGQYHDTAGRTGHGLQC